MPKNDTCISSNSVESSEAGFYAVLRVGPFDDKYIADKLSVLLHQMMVESMGDSGYGPVGKVS